MLIAQSLKALAVSLLALVPVATHACDALVGTYAFTANGAGSLDIAKTKHGYALSKREDVHADGPWTLIDPAMRSGTSAQLQAGGGVGVDIDAKSCGLASKEGLFLKVKVGARYQDNTRTGQNSIETRTSRTGFMLYISEGMMVGGIDLYRVPFSGTRASLPVDMARAARGREVPALPVCPGAAMPDMTQAAFDALPSALRDDFARRNAQAQRHFVCGQRLNNLTTSYSQIGSNATITPAHRTAALAEARALLDAGQTPRDENGKINWWGAINHVAAAYQLTNSEQPVTPLRDEYYALIQEKMLPRAAQSGVAPDAEAARGANDFIGRVVSMPTPTALAMLRQLKAMGATGWHAHPDRSDNPNNAMDNLERTLQPAVPFEIFDFLLSEAGAAALDNYWLLNEVVVKRGNDKLARLLRAGMKPGAAPAHFEVMARAQKYGNAEIYRLLNENIERDGGKVAPYVTPK